MLIPRIIDFLDNVDYYRCPHCHHKFISRIIHNPSSVYEDIFSGGIAIYKSKKTKIEYICPKCKTTFGYDWDIKTVNKHINDNCRYSYEQYDAKVVKGLDWYLEKVTYASEIGRSFCIPTEATKKAIKVAEEVIDAVFSDLHKEDKYYRSFEEAKKDIIDRYSKKIPKEYRFTIDSIEVNETG